MIAAIFSADFGFRRIPWHHGNEHSVKERLFLSFKNGMNSLAFSSCPIYKSYIGQTNWKRNESALLGWATRRRPFIRSCWSRGLLSITWHRYRPTQCSLGDTGKKVVEFRHRINNISVRSCEKYLNSAQNSVKATDTRTNTTDAETRKNIVQ